MHRIALALIAAASTYMIATLAAAHPSVTPHYIACGTLNGPTVHVARHGTTHRFTVKRLGSVTCTTALRSVPLFLRQHAKPLAPSTGGTGHGSQCDDLPPAGPTRP